MVCSEQPTAVKQQSSSCVITSMSKSSLLVLTASSNSSCKIPKLMSKQLLNLHVNIGKRLAADLGEFGRHDRFKQACARVAENHKITV